MQTTISKDVLKQGLGAVFCAAISFALVMFLARRLGTGQFGHYVAVLNGVTVGLILVEGGWSNWLYRERAASHSNGSLSVMRHGMAHVLLATVVALASTWALGGGWSWVSAWFCMGMVALMNLVSARLRGEGQFGWDAIWQSSGRLVSAAGIVWVLYWTEAPSVASVFFAWALGLGGVLAMRARCWLVLPQWRDLLPAYPQALVFVAIGLATAWLVKGDVVLLSRIQVAGDGPRDEVLSLYAACTRVSELCLLLYAPLGNVLLGSFSRQAGSRALLWRVWLVVLVIGSVVVMLAYAVGPAVMDRVFGAPYTPAGVLLPWVLLMLPFALANLVLVQWLTARGEERSAALWLVVAGLTLWLSVGLCAEQWGARGVACAVAATHALLMFVLLFVSRAAPGTNKETEAVA